MATKRHKRRKNIHLLCVLCLLVAPLFCFPSGGSISKSTFPSDPGSRGGDRCEPKTFPLARSQQCRNWDAKSQWPQRRGNKTPSTKCLFSCSAAYPEGIRELSDKCKINPCRTACPRAERRLHPLEYPGR